MQSQLYSLPKCPLWTLDTMSSHVECAPPSPSKKIFTYKRFPQRVRPITYMCDMYNNYMWSRGGSRGRVQGLRTPPPEMTCGFLIQLVFCKKKKKLCGLSVLKQNKRRVHPLLKKKNWIRPCGECDNKIWPGLFKRWIALSTEQITIQGTSPRETNCVIHWIDFYLVDRAIQRYSLV